MILIGLYIYIFCGILWMIKIRDIMKTAFDKTNYKAINIAGTVLFTVFCWLPLFIYWLHGYLQGYIIGRQERLEKEKEEHKEN